MSYRCRTRSGMLRGDTLNPWCNHRGADKNFTRHHASPECDWGIKRGLPYCIKVTGTVLDLHLWQFCRISQWKQLKVPSLECIYILVISAKANQDWKKMEYLSIFPKSKLLFWIWFHWNKCIIYVFIYFFCFERGQDWMATLKHAL